jgi:hypothetical protein
VKSFAAFCPVLYTPHASGSATSNQAPAISAGEDVRVSFIATPCLMLVRGPVRSTGRDVTHPVLLCDRPDQQVGNEAHDEQAGHDVQN